MQTPVLERGLWNERPQKMLVGDSPFGNEAGTYIKNHNTVTSLDSIICQPGIYPEEIIQKRENHKHLKVFVATSDFLEYVPPLQCFLSQ